MDGASAPQTNGRTNGQTTASLPQETIDFAGKVFNLARQGGDELLGTYLEAGLPANLTNDKGRHLSKKRPWYYTNLVTDYRKHAPHVSSI